MMSVHHDLSLVLIMLVNFVVFGSGNVNNVNKQIVSVPTSVVHLSDKNFKTYSASKEFLLFDFSSKW